MVNEIDPLLRRSKDIEAMVPYWEKVEAIVEGQSAIKRGKTAFLPKFPAETDTDYDFRLSIAKFTNIYRDVLEGLATKPFEEEVTLIGGEAIPDEINSFIENVDGSGNNLSMFSALTFFNGINNGIDWIFIDYPTVDTSKTLSKADVKAQNIKPYWTHIIAKNVLEARTETIGSKEVLSYIKIFEPSLGSTPDRVREWFRSADGVVTWKLSEKKDKIDIKPNESLFVEINGGVATIDVIPYVPFVTGRRDGKSFYFSPPMRDAADLQIVLYQDESGLQFIKIMAGYPMLAANGMQPVLEADNITPKKVAIGPGKVLYGVPDGNGNNGEWKFIEPNANSMEFLKKSIDKTVQDLRELGRQPLTALSTQLTTVTTSIAAGKARSAVSAWALGLKDTLENALTITMKWMNIEGYKAEVNVYTGFDNVADDGSDLDALLKMREAGDLSRETLHFEMKRRKVLSPEHNNAIENQRILNEIPSDEADSPFYPEPMERI